MESSGFENFSIITCYLLVWGSFSTNSISLCTSKNWVSSFCGGNTWTKFGSIKMNGLSNFSPTCFDFWYSSSVVAQQIWHTKFGNESYSFNYFNGHTKCIFCSSNNHHQNRLWILLTSHLKCSLIMSIILISLPKSLKIFK